MKNLNKVILSGHLTKDVVLTKTDKGNVVNFQIGCNKDKETCNFINCEAWNGIADSLSNYAKKGHFLVIEGRLEVKKYTKDEKTKTYTVVVVEHLEIA